LSIDTLGGRLAIHLLGAWLAGLFFAIDLALVVFGVTVVVAPKAGAWR
jgi:hypothetical protein